MDLNRLVSGLTQSGLASGLAGGVAGGALTGALMSKKGRKHAATALQIGGLAAIGGLAWKAYRSYRQGQPDPAWHPAAASPVAGHATRSWQGLSEREFIIDPADAGETSQGLLVIRAMIAAANADGHIDAEERQRIFAEVERLSLSSPEKALLFDELARPATIAQVVDGVGSAQAAVEVYAASVLAVDASLPAGRTYLEALASRLGLPAPLVAEIHAQSAPHSEAA